MDTKKTDAQRAAYSVGASEYLGVLAGEVNEAMRRTDEVLAEYERIKPLIELADSNPNYRLAVVDEGRTLLHETAAISKLGPERTENAYYIAAQIAFKEGYRRVVKMEDK